MWEIRCLAAMMLQQQFLHLSADDVDESLRFLGRMGLLGVGESADRIRDGVLKEGYTSTEPMAFLVEFRRHMERLGRVLSPIGRRRVTSRALRDFVATRGTSAARYPLPGISSVRTRWPGEILARVRRSTGESAPFNYPYAFEESSRKVPSSRISRPGCSKPYATAARRSGSGTGPARGSMRSSSSRSSPWS